MKQIKKLFYSLALVLTLLLAESTSVLAAELPSNEYIEHPTVYSSVEAHELTATYSTRAKVVTHHLAVKAKYGLAGGCTLTGSYWCTDSSGAMTSASYTTQSTYYHSDGTQVITPSKSGSSSSSSKYEWSDSISAMVNGPLTTSTKTVGTCVKTGYETVTITKTTSN